MKKQQLLKLEDLKVKSFVTEMGKNQSRTINGGLVVVFNGDVSIAQGCVSKFGTCTDDCW